jgi:sterol desaturase/sphingolipid hydroxylase (fatty acid hydroxylase superfamily)
MNRPSMRDWHWPHLLLLALWPAWTGLAVATALPATAALFAWLVANVIVLAFAERRRPHRADWAPTRAHLRRDGTVWSLNLLADSAAGAVVAFAAITLTPGDLGWPLWTQVAFGIAVAEFGSYWLHRWSHADNWLWRVHLLHHRPERMNTANALTAHPLNAIYNHLARALPLIALGLSPDALLAVALFGVTQSLVTHANIAGHIGWLDRIIGSADLHRLHHSTREDEAGNFGTTVPLWDQLFGTYRRGAAPARVGVFAPAAYPDELALGRLLAWPFTAATRACAACLRCCS